MEGFLNVIMGDSNQINFYLVMIVSYISFRSILTVIYEHPFYIVRKFDDSHFNRKTNL